MVNANYDLLFLIGIEYLGLVIVLQPRAEIHTYIHHMYICMFICVGIGGNVVGYVCKL